MIPLEIYFHGIIRQSFFFFGGGGGLKRFYGTFNNFKITLDLVNLITKKCFDELQVFQIQ